MLSLNLLCNEGLVKKGLDILILRTKCLGMVSTLTMYRKCIVCGRKFPEGQGIVISFSKRDLCFHSKKCAVKFLRRLVDKSLEEPKISKLILEVAKEFEEKAKEPEKKI